MKRPIQHGLALFALGLSAAASASERPPLLLGAGVYTIPVYPGSKQVEVRAVPIADVVLWDRLFLRTGEGVGVYLWRQPSLEVGISVDADLLHRYEVDDSRLTGLGDVAKTARSNLFITQRCRSIEATVKLSTDLGGAGHGNGIDIQLSKPYDLTPRLNIRTGLGATWANAQGMRTFFGVDPRQSSHSGLPVFMPDSGFSTARLFLGARYALRPQWLIGGQLYASRLLGDAADSPITQKRTTLGGGVYAAYLLR